jgi:hypothetical protein
MITIKLQTHKGDGDSTVGKAVSNYVGDRTKVPKNYTYSGYTYQEHKIYATMEIRMVVLKRISR